MGLRLGGACSDRGPANQIGDVLGHDRVENLRGRRQSECGHIEQQLTRHLDSPGQVAGVVEMGVVDEAFPADCRARLLKIDTHHQKETIPNLPGEVGQAPGIVDCRNGIVDRAGAHDHEQAGILAAQDTACGLAVLRDTGQNVNGGGQPLLDLPGGHQARHSSHAKILGAWFGGCFCEVLGHGGTGRVRSMQTGVIATRKRDNDPLVKSENADTREGSGGTTAAGIHPDFGTSPRFNLSFSAPPFQHLLKLPTADSAVSAFRFRHFGFSYPNAFL